MPPLGWSALPTQDTEMHAASLSKGPPSLLFRDMRIQPALWGYRDTALQMPHTNNNDTWYRRTGEERRRLDGKYHARRSGDLKERCSVMRRSSVGFAFSSILLLDKEEANSDSRLWISQFSIFEIFEIRSVMKSPMLGFLMSSPKQPNATQPNNPLRRGSGRIDGYRHTPRRRFKSDLSSRSESKEFFLHIRV